MALSDHALCSRSLLLLGALPISSLSDDESDNARTCAALYPGLRDNHLSSYPWRFATMRTSLTRLAGTPASAWTYSFVLPSNRASYGAFAVFASGAVGAPPFVEWEIIGDRLYANAAEIWIEYTRLVTEADFPYYFSSFLEAALASYIAFPVTDQQNAATFWRNIAFGLDPDVPGGLLSQAMTTDAQQHPAPSFETAGTYDLIEARMSG